MKKSYLFTGIAILVVVGGAVAFMAMGSSSKDDSKSKSKVAYVAVDACKTFTLDEAKKLLGDKATAGSNTPATKGQDVQVSTCSYVNNASTVAEIKTATVLYRSGLNADGAASNKSGFEANMTKETVDGYGEHAYWDASLGQLNIHKGNDWIIVSMGGTNPKDYTVADAKLVADQVLN